MAQIFGARARATWLSTSSSSGVQRARSTIMTTMSTSDSTDVAERTMYRFIARCFVGWIPGVSTKITWSRWSVITPSRLWRVVWGLREVMLSFRPSKWFQQRRFADIGRPTSAT